MSNLNKRNPIAKAIKLALLAGAAITGLSSTAVFAEEDAGEDEASEDGSRIVVTGSRIKRSEFSSSSPVNVFSAEEINLSGLISPDDFLKTKPAFTGFQLGASTNNGGDGQKKVDMRGLGFNRTLVLINGRRMIGDVNGDGAVDLGNIPVSMIERVDVLKDGASTVYGTDAIAGVVNYILKTDFNGAEFSVNLGETSEGDAANTGFSALLGASSNRGHVVMAMEYQKQDEMLQQDRAWSHDALYSLLQDDGSFAPIASGSSNSRRIRGIAGLPGNYIVDETTGRPREFEATDVYNYAPINALVTPNERWQFAANGSFELTDSLVAFTETLYTRRTSQQRLAPDASFGVTANYTSLVTGLPQRNDLVPASNPFNPFGDAAAGTDGICGTADDLNDFGVCGESVRINRRFEESGGRLFRQSSDTFRMVAGLRGDINDLISWDFAYTFAQNEVISETKNYHRFDRWEIAVTPSLCASNPTCNTAGVLNPFSPFGGISPEQMQFLSANSLKDLSFGEMEMWQVGLVGETEFEFDGGPFQWAVGYETRKEHGRFTPDEFSAEGLTTGGASDPQFGRFTVDEAYAEVVMPITEHLTVDLSTRSSSYDTSAGDTTIFKVGVDWEMADGIRLRSGFGTGFRAPNITELNQDQATGFPIIEPICEFSDRRTDITDTQRANCDVLVNTLVGFDGTGADGEFGFAWQSAFTTAAPETPLSPEESENFSIGLVFSDVFVEGLTGSIDYWKIEIDKWIGAPDMNAIFRDCLDSAGLVGVSCAAFEGNLPAAGDDFYTYFPNATGNPIDFIFPADAEASFGNLGNVVTDGVDLELQYVQEVEGGKLDLRMGATYMLSRETTFELSGTQELVGTADGFGVYPELRMNTSVRYSTGDWSVAWNTNYIGETDDLRRPPELTDDAVAEDVLYHDLVGTYNYDNYSFIFGINNVADQDPPRFHSAFNANTEPGAYDVMGRRFFASVKVAF